MEAPESLNQTQPERFYKMPKMLFQNSAYANLSNTAKLVYMLLLDRLQLSKQNGWLENGIVYLYFGRTELQKILSISDKTCTKAIGDLKSHKLITEKRQGNGKPNKFFITDPEFLRLLTRKNSVLRPGEITTLDPEFFRPNETERKDTYRIKEDEEGRANNKKVLKAYRKKIYPELNNQQVEHLYSLVQDFGPEWVLKAIEVSAPKIQRKGSGVDYLNRVLIDWNNKGVPEPWNITLFQPPTREEVQNFCNAQQCHIDIDAFLDYYQANGWKVGANKMADWKAAVRNWRRRNQEKATQKPYKTSEERQREKERAADAYIEALAKGGEHNDTRGNQGNCRFAVRELSE